MATVPTDPEAAGGPVAMEVDAEAPAAAAPGAPTAAEEAYGAVGVGLDLGSLFSRVAQIGPKVRLAWGPGQGGGEVGLTGRIE